MTKIAQRLQEVEVELLTLLHVQPVLRPMTQSLNDISLALRRMLVEIASIKMALQNIQRIFLDLRFQVVVHFIEHSILIHLFCTIRQLDQLCFNIIIMNRRIIPLGLLIRILRRNFRFLLRLHSHLFGAVGDYLKLLLLLRCWFR